MSAAYQPTQKIYFGAAYYPEHWPEEHWPEDIRLMQEAGMTVSRLAEFAWSTMEPAEGEFDFDWLEKAIAMLEAAYRGDQFEGWIVRDADHGFHGEETKVVRLVYR